MGRRHTPADEGSISLEIVIAFPVTMLAVLLALNAALRYHARNTALAAARDTARQASIARDPTTAQANATSSARAALAREGLNCPAQASVDTSGSARPVGEPATGASSCRNDTTARYAAAHGAPPGGRRRPVSAAVQADTHPVDSRAPAVTSVG